MRVPLTLGLTLAACLLPATALAKPQHSSRSTHAIVRHGGTTAHPVVRHAVIGSMASERAAEIQSALIQHGYLSGEPTGAWDSQTIAAMQKLQGENGWQTRITPDARALIKLGLGPQTATQTASPTAPPPSQ